MTNFETQVCSRCHGSGSYSYCTDYGDKCFKCAGSGKTLTKRGEAARAYLEKLNTIPVESLKVGDRVAATGLTNAGKQYGYIGTVTAIVGKPVRRTTVTVARADGRFDVSTRMEYVLADGSLEWFSSGSTGGDSQGTAGTKVEDFTYYIVTISSKYGECNHSGMTSARIYGTKEEQADKIAKALEYQATLTKLGKERKNAKQK